MKKLYQCLSGELDAGRGAVLCSITGSSGSTPRGTGAKMLVLEDGSTLGTVGGGAAEYRAAQYARTLLAEKKSAFASYSMTSGGNTGMACGGEITVYFQYFDPAEKPALLEEAAGLLSSTRAAWLVTAIDAGCRWRMGIWLDGLRGLPNVPAADVEPLLGRRAVWSGGLYVEPLARPGTVYIFGAGHVGRALCHVLALADFRVVVWDQRQDAATRDCLPDAAVVYCGPYEGAAAKLDPVTDQDYIVVMTPGHADDYTVLTQVLRSPAKYIGCIGSRKKVAAAREKLLAAGFSAEEIDRVYAPIGLPIGGETPGEIAISVAAQMIACRWGKLEGNCHAAN